MIILFVKILIDNDVIFPILDLYDETKWIPLKLKWNKLTKKLIYVNNLNYIFILMWIILLIFWLYNVIIFTYVKLNSNYLSNMTAFAR